MHYIRLYQGSMSSLELCKKPVITAIHSGCLGAGVDLVTAADMRYCSKDAYFQVKEVTKLSYYTLTAAPCYF